MTTEVIDRQLQESMFALVLFLFLVTFSIMFILVPLY